MSPESTGYSIPKEDFRLEGGEVVVDRSLEITVRYKPEELKVIVDSSPIPRRVLDDFGLTPDARRIILITPPSSLKNNDRYYKEDFYHMQRFRKQLGFIGEGKLQCGSLKEIDLLMRAGVISEDNEVGLAYIKILEEKTR